MKNTSLISDLCIIGAGSGGLSVAAAASQMGAKVILIESHKMGGDCLNYGCVPSKSLIEASRHGLAQRQSQRFGLSSHPVEVSYQQLHRHVHEVIENIAPHDSVERFEGLGVKVIHGRAAFHDKHHVVVDDTLIFSRYFVIATGSHAAIPPIKGLDKVPYLTNETIFDLTVKPTHLVVIGGGPIGCELAQAYALLGCKVTLLELATILPKDEPDCVDIVRKQLIASGIEIYEHIAIDSVNQQGSVIEVTCQDQQQHNQSFTASHLLVAAGRKPNLDDLQLDRAHVAYTQRGINVDKRLRTSNKRIFAMGDVTGSYQFTHVASYHAGIIIRNVLFRWPAKVDYRSLPWVTYTTPELAHVGLTCALAESQGVKIKETEFFFADIDRAQASYTTDGKIKILTDHKGYIVGATIVGAQAGELILPWVLAIQQHLKMSAMARVIAPYPTLSEISKRVAGQYFAQTIFSSKIRRIVRLLAKLP